MSNVEIFAEACQEVFEFRQSQMAAMNRLRDEWQHQFFDAGEMERLREAATGDDAALAINNALAVARPAAEEMRDAGYDAGCIEELLAELSCPAEYSRFASVWRLRADAIGSYLNRNRQSNEPEPTDHPPARRSRHDWDAIKGKAVSLMMHPDSPSWSESRWARVLGVPRSTLQGSELAGLLRAHRIANTIERPG